MRMLVVAVTSAAALGLAACTTVNQAAPAPSTSRPPASASPSGGSAPASAPTTAAPPTPETVPNVTSPWAVVSAYYGDIESGNYAEAWALLDSGATTGQTYQQFVAGFACTGSQQVTDDGTSGDQVSFSLAATDTCTGQVHTYSGTDTVQNGKIVAADVTQTS
jgi:hypothetical protein